MSGDDPRFDEVADLVLDERLGDARSLLDQIALDGARARDPVVTARALRLAASLSRLLGDPAGGIRRLNDGLRVPGSPADLRLELTAQLGDMHLAVGAARPAADAYAAALLLAVDADTAIRVALLHKRATALRALGQLPESAELLEEAGRLAEAAGDPVAYAQLLVLRAGVLDDAGDPGALAVAEAARRHAERTGDVGTLAEIALLDAARALRDDEPETALSALERARAYSLEAVAPHVYVGAAIATARLTNFLGARDRAYESLVVAWVTLGDLLGRDVAEATFAAELRGLRDEWGRDAFEDVKRAYEQRRREELASTDGDA